MSEERRPCLAKNHGETVEGYFVKFAPIKFTDDENKPYVAEMAIIETEHGQVLTVQPQAVRFKK